MATLVITDDPIDYDVGDLGEAEFDRWCIKANVVANQTQRDRKGWDFIVELPATDPRFRHDEITAKVQVKATKHGAQGAHIKLDNLARMATDPMPWFVLYYAFDSAGEIEATHMVHVDERIIANAHDVIAAESSGELHRRKIQVKWEPTDQIDHANPRALLQRLTDSVGGSMYDYSENKARWNTKALTRRISGSLSFPGSHNEAYERLADLAVGLVEELPVEITKMIDRIGAAIVPEGAVIEKSVISIENREPESATIEVQFGFERAVLNARMLTSAVWKAIPVEHHKVRVFTDLVSLVIGAKGVSMSVDFPASKVSLSVLGQTGRLLRLLGNPGAKLTLRAKDLAHTVELNERRERGGARASDALIWERVARISNHVGLPHDLEVLPSLMLVQRDQISSLARLIDGAKGLARFVVELHDQTVTASGDAAVVVAPKVLLGEYAVVAIAAVRGGGEAVGGMLTIDAPRVETMRIEARHRDELTRDVLEQMLRDAAEALKAQLVPIVTVISKAPFTEST